MKRFAKTVSYSSSIISIILWIVFIFFNPNLTEQMTTDVVVRTVMMLLLPALLALGATITSRNVFLLIAFLWSLPLSVYLALTPSIFALFILTSIGYFVSYLITWRVDRNTEKE